MQLDTFNEIVGHGINIYGSRERIRGELIDNAKRYLQLEGIDENIYRTSLVSYIVDTLSILSANQLFYDSVIYREFFMVEAQFQESVYNLARWVGYSVPKAIAATVDVLIKIPLTFTSEYVTFTIPGTFKAYAANIPFTVDSGSHSIPSASFNMDRTQFEQVIENEVSAGTGKIINNSALMVRDGKGFIRPVYISRSQDNKTSYATFALPFKQHEKKVFQFMIPGSIQQYQFYSKLLEFNGMVSGIRVWVIEPDIGEKFLLDTSNTNNFNPDNSVISVKNGTSGDVYEWEEWTESSDGIYTMAANSKQFVFVGGDGKAEVFFGNGIVGKQPVPNSIITIEVYITRGEDGIVLPNMINKGDDIFYAVNRLTDNEGQVIASDVTTKLHSISYSMYNAVSPSGALNTPSLPEVKRNAIVNLRSKAKLVSELDYDDINTIMGPNFPTVEAFPILKRSDIKVNEILAFLRLLYHDEYSIPQIIPTRNAKIEVINPTLDSSGRYTILRTSKFFIDNNLYENIFNFTINRSTMTAGYDYIAKNIFGAAVTLYSDTAPNFYIQYVYAPIVGADFDVTLEKDDSSSSSSSEEYIFSGNGKYPLNIKLNVTHVPVNGSEDLKTKLRARMITKWGSNKQYQQLDTIKDYGEKVTEFNFTIDNYLEIPTEIQRFEFYVDVYGILRDSTGNYLDADGVIIPPDDDGVVDRTLYAEGWMPLQSYYIDILIRKDLSDVMKSEVTRTQFSDPNTGDVISTNYQIHNVPVILSDYISGVVSRESESSTQYNFEVIVMQKLLQNLTLEDKRMMTDFINIKFPDTTGTLNNMKYNPVEHVITSRYRTPFNIETPDNIIFVEQSSSSSSAIEYLTKYIVNGEVPGYENMPLSSYINFIAEWYPNNDSGVWYLIRPSRGMYCRVLDELDSTDRYKIIADNGDNWIDVQDFTIPLFIKLKVEMDPLKTLSESQLIDNIKYQLINHFGSNMGIQKRLDRSEIVTVVRATPGVLYCELVSPAIDIRFDYNIKDLTQPELMDYTPQYVGFTEDTIDIEVVNRL